MPKVPSLRDNRPSTQRCCAVPFSPARVRGGHHLPRPSWPLIGRFIGSVQAVTSGQALRWGYPMFGTAWLNQMQTMFRSSGD